MTENNNAVMFRTADGKISVDVTLEKETVWLTQKQMATLFEKDVRRINEHIINVYKLSGKLCRMICRFCRIK